MKVTCDHKINPISKVEFLQFKIDLLIPNSDRVVRSTVSVVHISAVHRPMSHDYYPGLLLSVFRKICHLKVILQPVVLSLKTHEIMGLNN